MDELNRIKSKRKSYTNTKTKKTSYTFINKILLLVILTLINLILIKSNSKYKELFYNEVFTKNLSFAKINNIYEKYLGSFIPKTSINSIKPVFNEKLSYKEINKYLDGASLVVDDSYLVPAIQSGLIVFIGEKEGYGKTVIIQGIDGIDIWYGNLDIINNNLYDYVEKSSMIANTVNNNLYIVYKKDGITLDYEKYL